MQYNTTVIIVPILCFSSQWPGCIPTQMARPTRTTWLTLTPTRMTSESITMVTQWLTTRVSSYRYQSRRDRCRIQSPPTETHSHSPVLLNFYPKNSKWAVITDYYTSHNLLSIAFRFWNLGHILDWNIMNCICMGCFTCLISIPKEILTYSF